MDGLRSLIDEDKALSPPLAMDSRFVSPFQYIARLEESVLCAEIGALTPAVAHALEARRAEIVALPMEVQTLTLAQLAQDVGWILAGMDRPRQMLSSPYGDHVVGRKNAEGHKPVRTK